MTEHKEEVGCNPKQIMVPLEVAHVTNELGLIGWKFVDARYSATHVIEVTFRKDKEDK